VTAAELGPGRVVTGWVGRGTAGRQAIYRRRGERGRTQGFRGYAFRPLRDGGWADVWYCRHAHQSSDAAAACGERQAARLNKAAGLSPSSP
jgi:hypothetical protein